jgi:hypothetical protein
MTFICMDRFLKCAFIASLFLSAGCDSPLFGRGNKGSKNPPGEEPGDGDQGKNDPVSEDAMPGDMTSNDNGISGAPADKEKVKESYQATPGDWTLWRDRSNDWTLRFSIDPLEWQKDELFDEQILATYVPDAECKYVAAKRQHDADDTPWVKERRLCSNQWNACYEQPVPPPLPPPPPSASGCTTKDLGPQDVGLFKLAIGVESDCRYKAPDAEKESSRTISRVWQHQEALSDGRVVRSESIRCSVRGPVDDACADAVAFGMKFTRTHRELTDQRVGVGQRVLEDDRETGKFSISGTSVAQSTKSFFRATCGSDTERKTLGVTVYARYCIDEKSFREFEVNFGMTSILSPEVPVLHSGSDPDFSAFRVKEHRTGETEKATDWKVAGCKAQLTLDTPSRQIHGKIACASALLGPSPIKFEETLTIQDLEFRCRVDSQGTFSPTPVPTPSPTPTP